MHNDYPVLDNVARQYHDAGNFHKRQLQPFQPAQEWIKLVLSGQCRRSYTAA